MKQKSTCKLIVLFFALVFFGAINAWSQAAGTPEAQHEALKKSYFRLKNIDSKIKDKVAWSKVVSDYREFFERADGLSDKIYFEYGSLLQEYGGASADNKLIDESIKIFEELSEKYPRSSIADDALLKQAELLTVRGVSSDALKDLYRDVIEKFPNSDSAEIARVRLSRSEGFTSKDLSESEVDSNKQEIKKSSDSLPVLVLDPGHGGDDFGAENEQGLLEKDVVLAVALEVERLINQRGFAKVLLTRRKDTFVPLLERVEIANRNNAILFLSLHNNASPKHNQSGMNTYILDNSSDEASRLLAERENKSAGESATNSDLDFIVSDLIQSSKHPKSILLAESLNKIVPSTVRTLWPQIPAGHIKKAPFYVLVGARMPCALAELFFLDHEVDSEYLGDPAFRKVLAEGIAKGLEVFMAKSRG
jgi:N-acetylmuramoyl-L-alanine amidase